MVRTAGVTILGAIGALLWLSSVASAQVGSPTSEPFKPYSPTEQPGIFIPESPPSTTAPMSNEAPVPEPAPAEEPAPAPVVAEAPEPAVEALAAEAAPGPRAEARRPRPPVRPVEPVLAEAAKAPDGFPVRSVTPAGPLERVRSVLSELASVCNVGVSFPTGGPVLAFAILAAALGLDGQRFQRTRRPADEDAPELLYAGDVIAPG